MIVLLILCFALFVSLFTRFFFLLRCFFFLTPIVLCTAEKLLVVNTLVTMMTQPDDSLRRLDTSNTSTQSNELQRIIGCEIIQRTFRSYLADQEMKNRHLTRQQELQLKATTATLLLRQMGGKAGGGGVLHADRDEAEEKQHQLDQSIKQVR
jgi:hypothetical protein